MNTSWPLQDLKSGEVSIISNSEIDDFYIDMANLFDPIPPPSESSSNMLELYKLVYDTEPIPQNSRKVDLSQDSILNLGNGRSSPDSLRSLLDSDLTDDSAPSASQDKFIFHSTTDEFLEALNARDTTKRSRNTLEGDSISACWTSPVCQNKKDDGSRPDSCKGECADFLFTHPSELPDDKRSLLDMMAKSRPRVTLESPSKTLKRQNMDTTPEMAMQSVNSSMSESKSKLPLPSLVARPSHLPPSTLTSPTDTKPSKSTIPILLSTTVSSKNKLKGRVPHNQVEKKYRENVNAQLEALRRVVPVSRQQLNGFDGFDMEDLGANNRTASKAVILSSATAYIQQLEKDTEHLAEEIKSLKAHNKTLQSLTKCDDCSLMGYMQHWRIQQGV